LQGIAERQGKSRENTLDINIQLQPKQIELYRLIKDSDYLVIGYGGSKGGAKSHGLRDVLTLLCLEYGGLQTAIFRRISKQLMDNHIVPYFTKYPELRQFYNVQDRIMKFPNGSILRFRSADQEDEIYNIQGSEFDVCAVDEATHFTKKQLDFLRTCVRGKIGFKAKSVWTTNPGNISHTYIKRIFINKQYDENENPRDYYYLPAKVYDNAIWVRDALIRDGLSADDYYGWTDEKRREYCTPENSLYVRNLKGLPKDLQDAYLEGDWDIFGGAFFKNFSRREEIIKPFKIPSEWQLIGSIDPGWSSPCSFGLTARDFEGNYYRIFTYYESQKSPQDHADSINEMIQSCEWTGGRYPQMIMSGKDAFAHKDRYSIMANDVTFADVFNQKGLYLTPAVTDRKQGWWAWKSLMPDKYFVFSGMNEPLTDEISAVISDGKQVEDIQGRGNDPNVSDHALDEQRYGIMGLFQPSPQKEKQKEEINKPGQGITRNFEKVDINSYY
jgi:phage terminase large subunit